MNGMRRVLRAVDRRRGIGYHRFDAVWHQRHLFEVALAIAEGWLQATADSTKLKLTRAGRRELLELEGQK